MAYTESPLRTSATIRQKPEADLIRIRQVGIIPPTQSVLIPKDEMEMVRTTECHRLDTGL
jgi:hypothetical protein